MTIAGCNDWSVRNLLDRPPNSVKHDKGYGSFLVVVVRRPQLSDGISYDCQQASRNDFDLERILRQGSFIIFQQRGRHIGHGRGAVAIVGGCVEGGRGKQIVGRAY